MKEMLKKYMTSGSLIEIYSNCDDTAKFTVARIVYMDDRFVLLSIYDENGLFDGFLLKQIEDIYMIAQDSLYLQKLLELSKCEKYDIEVNQDALHTIINFSKDKGAIIEVQLLDSEMIDAQGIVTLYNDEIVGVTCIDDFGKYDGTISININAITSICTKSQRLMNIEKLYKLQ